MSDRLWYIVKDGLKALVAWAIISIILILLFGYTGRVLSGLVGIIFIISFCALRLRELVLYFSGNRGAAPAAGAATPLSTPAATGKTDLRPCPDGTDGMMTCPMCSGNGQRFEGGAQLVTCSGCQGRRRVPCTRCGGSGYLRF